MDAKYTMVQNAVVVPCFGCALPCVDDVTLVFAYCLQCLSEKAAMEGTDLHCHCQTQEGEDPDACTFDEAYALYLAETPVHDTWANNTVGVEMEDLYGDDRDFDSIRT
jgi:hypothetical protein